MRIALAGGAAHPGAGMPMVRMSGWIAADALDRDGVSARFVDGKQFGDLSGDRDGRRSPAPIGVGRID